MKKLMGFFVGVILLILSSCDLFSPWDTVRVRFYDITSTSYKLYFSEFADYKSYSFDETGTPDYEESLQVRRNSSFSVTGDIFDSGKVSIQVWLNGDILHEETWNGAIERSWVFRYEMADY